MAVVVWTAPLAPMRPEAVEGATEGAGAGTRTVSGGAVVEPVVVAAVPAALALAAARFLLGQSFNRWPMPPQVLQIIRPSGVN